MIMRKLLLPGIAVALAVGGCASRKQIVDLQAQNDALERGLDSVRANTEQMAAAVENLSTDFHAFTSQSQYGSTALEEKVEGLAARLDDIIQRMDRSLAPLQEWLRQQNSGGATGGAGVEFYDAAKRDLALGNYDLAEVGFLQFLESNPQSELADDARYGLGDTYFAKKQYPDAIEQFQRVIDLDPDGPNAAAAMLKIGLCYQADHNAAQARRVWDDLIANFPRAEEAGQARQRIDDLDAGR